MMKWRNARLPKDFAGSQAGVTLVELLISLTIVAMILALTLQIVSSLSSTWSRMSGRVEAFAAARAGFDAVARSVQQATLKSYFTYANAAGEPVALINPSANLAGLDRSKIPSRYLRASDLHFLVDKASDIITAAGGSGSAAEMPGYAVFFQAPLGRGADPAVATRSTLLNSIGYFIEYGDDSALTPSGFPTSSVRERYRLMELVQSADRNAVYKSTLELVPATGLPVYNYDVDWVGAMLGGSDGTKYVLAENIVYLAFLPKLSSYSTGKDILTDNYNYDSRWWEAGYTGKSPKDERIRSQLPPLLEVVMVSIDEPSAIRMAELYGSSTPPFASGPVKAVLDFDALFTRPQDLEADIKKIETGMAALKLNFRIFRTDIGIPAARWSGEL